ncbi:MAG TPA: hypothetical protein VG986_06565 [Pseudolabrys sp.]|nr:hypothetical protein [Pseudolabrys sp.]
MALVVAAATVAGCSNDASVLDHNNWFSKPVAIFAKPDWARPVDANTAELGPKGQVSANDFVNADGTCAPAETPPVAAAPAQPAPAPVVTASADPMGGLQTGGGPGPAATPLLGGIALGMSECEAVRRGGQPSNVTIGAGDKGERKVVITYQGGNLPGIYTFYSGRLKEIDQVPHPEKPKAAPKKKVKRAKSAMHEGPERVYVQ